mmetsp:Transcript_8116/g.30502  ORF Transcript_8116/g.30502 Transcript_8116/m.30502 type:complete len:259 (-) Transcript_8116:238-1014(-)
MRGQEMALHVGDQGLPAPLLEIVLDALILLDQALFYVQQKPRHVCLLDVLLPFRLVVRGRLFQELRLKVTLVQVQRHNHANAAVHEIELPLFAVALAADEQDEVFDEPTIQTELRQMAPKQIESHFPDGRRRRRPHHIAAVQVVEDVPHVQHLAAVLCPEIFHRLQEARAVHPHHAFVYQRVQLRAQLFVQLRALPVDTYRFHSLVQLLSTLVDSLRVPDGAHRLLEFLPAFAFELRRQRRLDFQRLDHKLLRALDAA